MENEVKIRFVGIDEIIFWVLTEFCVLSAFQLEFLSSGAFTLGSGGFTFYIQGLGAFTLLFLIQVPLH
jgi:hypothetical protein